ncbi:MAG: uroporphyrinogen decarboxylase family protein [Planctomycetota bacterium]
MATNLENFIATVEHRAPEQVLYHAHYMPDLQGRLIEHIGTEDIADHYGYAGAARVGLRKPDDWEPIDYADYYADDGLPEGTTFNAAGCAQIPSGFYHFWGYLSPLRNATSIDEIESYPLEDYSRWDSSHMAAEIKQAHAQGRSVHAYVGHIYETSWQIRGYEEFLIDTIQRPAWAEAMLDKLARQKWDLAIPAARAGVDCIHTGDDIANQKSLMFRKPVWRDLIFAGWRDLWAEIKRINPECRIFYHSDGNIIDVIPDLVDAGLDILNPLQPECLDVDRVHREFGHALTFDGTIGTQSTMPWGTPDEVRARVREVIDRYGRGGGLIVSPTHVLEPEVPLENIDAFFDACREFGDLSA